MWAGILLSSWERQNTLLFVKWSYNNPCLILGVWSVEHLPSHIASILNDAHYDYLGGQALRHEAERLGCRSHTFPQMFTETLGSPQE